MTIMNNGLDIIMNGKFIMLFVMVIILWLIFVPSQRSLGNHNKMKINRYLAALCGSKSDWVNWRSLSFQLGFASLIVWHILSVIYNKSHSSFVFVPALLTVFVFQVIFWLLQQLRRST